MKTVLYINPNGFIGGAESFIFNICESHLNNKKVIPIILFFKDGPGVKKAQEIGIKHFLLKTSFKLSSLTYIKACFEIRGVLKKVKPDVVHFTMPYSVVACFLPSLFLNIKTVWFQHGPVGGLLDKIASFLYVDYIFFNSKDTFLRHFNHCRDIFHTNNKIINLGIKTQTQINTLEVEKYFPSNQFTILSAGRICRWKGQHILIKAISELKKHNQIDTMNIKSLIAGVPNSHDDHLYFNELKELVRSLQLENHVEFIGHQKNIHQFYYRSDILVHTSTTPEPFGLVVAEAMSAGLLVIGADQGGLQDILINNETGYSFNTTASDAHLRLVNLIIENTTKDNSKIRRNAKNLIQNDYSITQMTDAIELIYEKI